jgi:DNA-binding beta-propeller fold protein YncE
MPFELKWERARGVSCLLLLLSVWPVSVTAQSAHSLGVISALGSGFSGPEGIAVDSSGDVFVADTNNSAVKEIVAVNGVVSSGSSVIPVGGGFNAPSGVAVDSSGDVFVADTNNSQVKEIMAINGKVSSSSPVIEIASGSFSSPYSVALDNGGDLFVADATNGGAVKEAVAINGAVAINSQVITISTGFSSPGGLAVDSSGDVFVANTGAGQVQEIVAVNGGVSSTSIIVPVGAGFNQPSGVAVDGSGNVFVADTGNSALKEIVAVNGAVSPGSTVANIGGGLDYPYGVALDGKGDVFVGDASNNAVKEITQKFPATAVGSASSAETVYFSFDSGGSLAATAYVVFTQGAQGLDFQAAATQPSNVCVGGHSYSTGSVCAVNVTFAPTKPNQRTGAIQLMGSAGTPIATGYLQGSGAGPQVTFLSNAVAPQIGGGFAAPYGVAVDGSGDVLVADALLSAVYEIVAVNGRVSASSSVVPVGSGFTNPRGVAVDGSGNVFVADYTNRSVKKIVAVNGAVSSSSSVLTVGSGFSAPAGVAVDGSGNVFVADGGNSAVKEIVAVNGVVTANSAVNTVGSGFGSPAGVAVDGSGNVFVADNGNSAVYQIVAVNGVVTSQSAVNSIGSGFALPAGVAVDGSGNVFVADTLNNEVKEIVAASGVVSSSSPVVPLSSGFFRPRSVALDSYGNVLVADTADSAAKEIGRGDPPSLAFANTIVGSTSSDSPQSVLFQNSGNQTLSAVSPGLAIGPNFVQVPGSGAPSDCTTGFTLSPGQQCNLSVSFIPTTAGSIVSTATFTDNALNASPWAMQVMQLSGTGQSPTPTSTVVTATPSVVVPGVSVQLTATVSSSLGAPPGSVTFTYGTNILGTVALSNGSAQITTTALPPGSDTLTASYSGASSSGYVFAASSGSAVVNVVTPPTLALVSLSPSSGNAPAQAFTAVYSDSSGASDISYASILFNTSNTAANGCYVNYYPASNALYLGNNSGVLTGPITPGSSATLFNSQCTLLGTGSSATISGNSLSIAFNLTFSSSFSSSDNIYGAMASLTAGVNGISQQLGTWNAGVQLPSTPVGSSSAATTIYFTFPAAVTLSSPPYVVLTQGAQNLDFQAAATQPSNACVGGQSYSAGSVCAVNVTFTPTKAYQRMGAVQLMSSGAAVATVYVNGTGTGPQALFPGNAPTYAVGSDFYGPQGVAVDASGDVFVTDYGQIPNAPSGTYASRVLEIVASNGVVTSTSQTLQETDAVNSNRVSGVAVDGGGNVFAGNSSGGTVTEFVAASGVVNFASSVTISGFSSAQGVAVDGNGNLFVADEGSATVYEVMAVNGVVTSASPKFKVGSGFSAPSGVAVDRFGNVFVSDLNTNGVYQIVAVNGVVSSSSSVIQVGSGFSYPSGVSVDGSGNVFVSDSNHNQIKEIVAVNGTVSSTSAVIPAGGGFTHPEGLAVDANGNVFVADYAAVKETDRKDPPSLSFASTPVGSTSSDSPQSVLFQNIGNQTLTAVSPGLALGANFVQVAGSGTPADCTAAFSLAPGQECNLSISFTPATATPSQATATFTDNYGTQAITLSGAVTPVISPTTLQFGSLNTGVVSAAQTVTVSNTGSQALSITGIALGGVNPADFAETTTCGTTLAGNANCTVSVTFAPVAPGSLSATLSVTTKAGSSSATQTVALSGTGVATGPVAGLTPTSLTFSSEPVGTASAVQTFTLSNTGTAALTIAGIAIGGANPGDFPQTNTCGSSLAAAGSCTISVKFDPAATGTRTASVIVTDSSFDVTGSTQTSTLSGTGTAATPAVASVSPNAGTGLTQTFTGVYSDPNGIGDLNNVRILFNTSVTGVNACYALYYPATNALYLENNADNGTAGPITPGSSSTLSNSQCTLNGTGSSVSSSGDNLTVNFAITFSSTFTGLKNTYLYATGATASSGWIEKGTWNTGIAGPPAVVSLTPASGTGLTQTFTAVYSDPKGLSDLTNVRLLVNTAVNGANACYLFYYPANNSIYLENNADNGTVGPLTPGSSSSISNSQCTINGAGSSFSTSGTNLTVNFSITFNSAFEGLKNTYLYATGATAASGWIEKGAWAPVSAGPPAVVSLTPASGSGLTQTFGAVYSDPNGLNDMSNVRLLVNAAISGVSACYVFYYPATREIFLENNADNGTTGPLTPGSTSSISNSQCTINGTGSSVSTSGTDLTVNLSITFASSFAGLKNTYLYATGTIASSGWIQKGSWTPASAIPPAVVSLTPASGTGTAETFTAVHSDPNGIADLTSVRLLMSTAVNGVNACYVYYYPQSNAIYLANNADNGTIGPLTPGSNSALSNSQCTVNGAGSSTSTSGNNLTVNYAITFSSTFTGSKNVYLASYSASASSGWIKEGTWTP